MVGQAMLSILAERHFPSAHVKALASERSNHISGKLIQVSDDWKRLENTTIHPEIYTLRRVQKVS